MTRIICLLAGISCFAAVPAQETNTDFGVYSAFTFVPGDKLIFYDDFAGEANGDFPAAWGTNGSGEVVTVSGKEGKWLSMKRRAGYLPNYSKPLPEQYTIEFDLLTNGYTAANGRSKIHMAFLPKKAFTTGQAGSCGYITLIIGDKNFPVETANFGSEAPNRISNKIEIPYPVNDKLHVSMTVKNRRLSVWFNQEKVLDAPSLLQGKLGDYFTLEVLDVLPEKGQTVLLGNVRIAAITQQAQDLLASGKFSTTAIYFNTNSATIKPESYAILKQLAEAIKTSGAAFKVVGHTDADGDATYNQTLSEKRADAVKQALVNMGADAGKLTTAGKGETNPVDDNKTLSGKANNRRVEFIKE